MIERLKSKNSGWRVDADYLLGGESRLEDFGDSSTEVFDVFVDLVEESVDVASD